MLQLAPAHHHHHHHPLLRAVLHHRVQPLAPTVLVVIVHVSISEHMIQPGVTGSAQSPRPTIPIAGRLANLADTMVRCGGTVTRHVHHTIPMMERS